MKLVIATLAAAAVLCATPRALARDNGQWEGSEPEIGAWFVRHKQPDNPRISCCGPADAYWADEFEAVRDSDGTVRFFAIVTDERDDEPLQRPHVAPGTRVEIPPHKFNDPRRDPNPTGHGIVFISTSGTPFCYYNPPGDG